MHREFLLGVVGHPSSGKDTVVEYLVKRYGFTHVSTSDLIREYITKNNLGDLSRPNLQKFGNALRAEGGPDVLMRMALETQAPRLAVSAIRTLGEVTTLKNAGGYLVTVNAPIKLRYTWARERGRVGEEISFEQFKEIEGKEATSNDPTKQNVNAVIDLADYIIENISTQEKLFENVASLMKQLDISK